MVTGVIRVRGTRRNALAKQLVFTIYQAYLQKFRQICLINGCKCDTIGKQLLKGGNTNAT